MVHHTLKVTKNLRYSACFNTFILIKIVFSNVYLHKEHIVDITVFFVICYLFYCAFTGQIWNLKTWSSAGLFSFWPLFTYTVTLYTLTSVCIFSILFSIHFLWYWQGEFVYQSRASLVGDHFLYSHDLDVWSMGWYCKENLDCSHSQAKGSFLWQWAL